MDFCDNCGFPLEYWGDNEWGCYTCFQSQNEPNTPVRFTIHSSTPFDELPEDLKRLFKNESLLDKILRNALEDESK